MNDDEKLEKKEETEEDDPWESSNMKPQGKPWDGEYTNSVQFYKEYLVF